GVEEIGMITIAKLGVGCRILRRELRVQNTHLFALCGQAVARPVRERRVVLVHSGERRIHGAAPVVMLEKAVEGRAHRASGIDTQRRSRQDSSTALMSSCTCAPSSKLPSFSEPSLRISE